MTRLNGRWLVAALVAAAVVAAGVYLLRLPAEAPAPPSPLPVVDATQRPAVPASALAAQPAPAPALAIAEPAADAAATTPADIQTALIELFGQKTVLALLQSDDFAHRLVATVDNLGREQASARLWPVNPTAGHFMVARQDGVDHIAADNGLRYTPFVLLIETVDLHRVVQVYHQLAPQFEQAYAALGFPGHPFQARLIEVIDLLMATPVPNGPLAVHLPSTQGPIPVPRPWVLYDFDDPQLQALAAGQKILVRMGPVNQRRLRAKLAELRGLLLPPGAKAR